MRCMDKCRIFLPNRARIWRKMGWQGENKRKSGGNSSLWHLWGRKRIENPATGASSGKEVPDTGFLMLAEEEKRCRPQSPVLFPCPEGAIRGDFLRSRRRRRFRCPGCCLRRPRGVRSIPAVRHLPARGCRRRRRCGCVRG